MVATFPHISAPPTVRGSNAAAPLNSGCDAKPLRVFGYYAFASRLHNWLQFLLFVLSAHLESRCSQGQLLQDDWLIHDTFQTRSLYFILNTMHANVDLDNYVQSRTTKHIRGFCRYIYGLMETPLWNRFKIFGGEF